MRVIQQAVLDSPPEPSDYLRMMFAMIDGRTEDALLLYRNSALKGEGFAMLTAVSTYPAMRDAFREFWEHPAQEEIRAALGLDAASRSNLRMPELPF